MARPATLYRAPKGAEIMIAPVLSAAEIAAGTSPHYSEHGRALEATATMESEPVIREEWSETNCSTYEEKRTYPDRAVTLEIGFRSAALARNVMLAWQGKTKAEAGGRAITDEPTRDDITAGDLHSLALPSDGSATITDSAAGSVVEGANWEWVSGSVQTIRILDVTTLTLPLLVSYNTTAATEVGIMNDMGQSRHMAIEASNNIAVTSKMNVGCSNDIMGPGVTL
jgi:hypothetical protein